MRATIPEPELPFSGPDASDIAELVHSPCGAQDASLRDRVDQLVELCCTSENQRYILRPFREGLRNLLRRRNVDPADLVDGRDRNILVALVQRNSLAGLREIFWLGLWLDLIDYRVPASSTNALAGKNAMETARQVVQSSTLAHSLKILTEQEISLSPFVRAARAGDLKMLQILLPTSHVDGHDLRYWRDSRGNSVLHHACAGRCVESLKFLIDLGLMELNAINDDGDNLLHAAVLYGTPAILQELLKRKDRFDLYWENGRGRTPVLLCAETGHKQMFTMFENAFAHGRRAGVPWDQRDSLRGGTCDPDLMSVAADAGQLKFLELCLRQFGYQRLRHHVDRDGSTVLHRACDKHRHDVVEFLLKEFDAKEMLLKRDRSQRTVLHRCCSWEGRRSLTKPNLLKVLLEAAERAGVLGKLIDANDFYTGMMSCVLVTGRDKGRAAYHYVEADRHAVTKFEATVNSGSVDVGEHGQVIASRWGDHPSEADWRGIELLLTETTNQANNPIRDVTALHVAVFHQSTHEVQLLLEHGADVHVRDRFGLMPLHYAAMRGDRCIMQALIDKGADLTATDTSHNRTALEIAELNGNEKIVAWLQSEFLKPHA